MVSTHRNNSQSGSALVYILIAIALLAALTASFMKPSSQQTSAQSSFNTITQMKSQIEFIRSSIQECVLNYPDGDTSDKPNIPASVVRPYPFTPTDGYFALTSGTGAASSAKPNNELQYIGCPGNPGNNKNHGDIFGGRSGKFLPPPPDLFNAWQYYNGTDGVFFFTETDKSDAFLQTAMEKLDGEFSECETDIIDASAAARELTSTAAGTDPKCPSGSTCFRVWVITQATATYNGDTDGDEAACP
ncbi:MAG TPA: hypothetical protein PLF01_01240 [Alphaproteobacteria bacterium]|nr:hypothetical protein [Alphaproteobacteria bacterium]